MNIPREFSANQNVVIVGEPRDIEHASTYIEEAQASLAFRWRRPCMDELTRIDRCTRYCKSMLPREVEKKEVDKKEGYRSILEMGPLLLFFGVNYFYGIMAGTAVLVISTLLSLILSWYWFKVFSRTLNLHRVLSCKSPS